MQRTDLGGFLQAACLAALVLAAGQGCGLGSRCEVLPRGPIERLSLHARELPDGYVRLEDQALLAALHLTANPDYVRRPSDLEQIAGAGGLASFLALYGRSNEVRLAVNGVYFQDARLFDAFVDLQRAKPRHVLALRRATTGGTWLLLAARHPDRAYEAGEIEALRKGLRRYAARLDLEPVFDQLENGHAP